MVTIAAHALRHQVRVIDTPMERHVSDSPRSSERLSVRRLENGLEALRTAGRLDTALDAVRSLRPPVAEVENVRLTEALGRISAAGISASAPLPRFDHSAMDGFAIALADVGRDSLCLRVRFRVAAGDDGAGPPEAGEALRILTGARLPMGVGAVVPNEDCYHRGAALVVSKPVQAGSNIRRTGEDVAVGAVILAPGTILDPRHVALLSATGITRVAVRRRVRVSVLSNGNELRDAGEPLRASQIHDCNRPMLLAALTQPWLETVDAGCHVDDPAVLARVFAEAAERSDIVISSGGVAGSDADHVAAAVAAAGGQVRQFQLPLKPGKAVLAGTIGNAAVLGLAGNPVAALVGLLLFGRTLVRAVAGLPVAKPAGRVAETMQRFSHMPGRIEFVPAKVLGIGPRGLPQIELLPGGSARLHSLVIADGLAEISADAGDLGHGSRVAFHPLPASFGF
jgi:molybdopterin molybdotransferase